ncbi:MAG: DUF1819 family protein [Synergistaceae bacterium]|nr:DUF1819 family protein [Synergistaceae bacterium]
MGNSEYAMSFSTGGLFRRESLEAASLFLQSGSWDAVRKEIMAKNLLQARTLSTLQRECREVLSRLRLLNGEELRFLVEAEYREQGHLLWIAVCRRYPFIRDFAVEVLRERYITLKADVRYEEFDAFFNAQSEAHPQLHEISSTTRKKLRQVLFKILRESELLDSDNTIIPVMPGAELTALISRGNKRELLLFPVFESDLKGMTQ